jgi:hypothetical protein
VGDRGPPARHRLRPRRLPEAVAVWYPSRAAFLSLEQSPGYQTVFELHRRAAIEHAVLICCDGDAEPKRTSPHGG